MEDNTPKIGEENKPVVDVVYNEPDFGNPDQTYNLEQVFGTFHMVTGVPTWTPKSFKDGIAFNTSSATMYYYDFTNKAWKSVTGGAGSGAILSTGIQNFSLSWGFVSYSDVSQSSPAGAETDVGNIITRSGTLKNLFIGIYSNSLNGSAVFTIYKNGSSTSVTVTITAGSVATTGDTTHTVSVAAGDRITLKNDVAGSSGTITCGFSYEVA